MSAQSVGKEGAMYWALGEAAWASSTARHRWFAAKVLTRRPRGQDVHPDGPRSLSMTEVAEQLGTALHKVVKYLPVSVEQAATSMGQMGMDAFGVNMMSDYLTAYSNNWGDFVTDDFKRVMGKEPRGFSEFAKDFRGAFGAK